MNSDSFKTVRYRFVILFLFSIAQVLNTTSWISFAPILEKLLFAYDGQATEFNINFLSWIFMIMFLPMNLPSVWFIEKKGLRASLIVGILI